jgi:hypothetical protein
MTRWTVHLTNGQQVEAQADDLTTRQDGSPWLLRVVAPKPAALAPLLILARGQWTHVCADDAPVTWLGAVHLAVPRAQVTDSDSDDLGRPVWTQRRVHRRELLHHVLSTEASVHQATDIQALVQRHLVTAAVPEASRTDICQERTPTAPRPRCRPLGASRYRSGVRNRFGTQGDGRQDGQANYPHPSRATVSPP